MESSLRALVRDGDHEAFGAVFDLHKRAVYNLAFRMSGNWSTAEEVVSLTFLEAWRKRAQLKSDGGSLHGWLLVIALNMTRNQSRSARRYQAAMARLPPPPAVPDFADELASRMDDETRMSAVRDALTRLPRGEQDVLALCVWSGLEYAAAADALGIPVGTVRSRLSRARQKIRETVATPVPDSHETTQERFS